MFQSNRHSWWQSLAALMFLGVAGSSGDSVLLALDDPFASEAVAKQDVKRDQPSAEDDDDDDEKGESLDQLRARLKQLEAENAKLRRSIEEKDEALGIKKPSEGKGKEKLPPIKFTKFNESNSQKPGEKHGSEQDEMVAKLKQIQEQIGRLQKEGRKEEVEKLTHIAQELQRGLAERQAKNGKGGKHDAPPVAERIEQLELEIEVSVRNGQKEKVEALRHELEKTVDQAHRFQKKGSDSPDSAPHAELGAVLKQLSGEVQKLRAEVDELRRHVKDRGDDRKK